MENHDQKDALLEMLKSIKPKPTTCSPEVREWWEKTALQTLKRQALSELWRNDEYSPRIMGFMKDGTMGIVDITKALGTFGDVRSKNATAFVHKIAALVPGTYASVFCTEAWALRGSGGKENFDRQRDKYPDLGDHPDRHEVLMFNMLHYDVDTNAMMQLATMIEVIKVLGANRSRKAWRDTNLGEDMTTDPLAPGPDGMKMTGRFIFGDAENPNDE